MARIEILGGEKFGMLTAIEESDYALIKCGKKGLVRVRMVLCSCSCGSADKPYSFENLRSGHTKTCGCRTISHVKHGMAATRQYGIWRGMKSRCTNKNNTSYGLYGGIGITVCHEWLSFDSFWSDMKEGYSDDLEIERIDNSRGYSKDNCRWATRSEQVFNRTNIPVSSSGFRGVHWHNQSGEWNARIEKDGVTHSLGLFPLKADAIEARRLAEIKYFGYSLATGWAG